MERNYSCLFSKAHFYQTFFTANICDTIYKTNCTKRYTGKSTIFNALTGMHQHTGNWNGKTVDCAEGEFIYKDTEFKLVDLPGIYSTNPVSKDEKCAVEYLKNEHMEVLKCLME